MTEAGLGPSYAGTLEVGDLGGFLVSSSGDLVLVFDFNDGSVVYCNPQSQPALGYTPEELVAMDAGLADLVHPEDLPRLDEHLFNLDRAAEKEPDYTDWRLRHCLGEWRWFSICGLVFARTAAGVPHLVLCHARDISDHKQALLKAQAREERYRTIADHSADWEYWLDAEGGVFFLSPSCERITGYPTEAFINDPDLLSEIVCAEDRELFSTSQHSPESSAPVELRITTLGGEERWISHSSQLVYDNQGKYLGRHASNRDISDRKLAEQEQTALQAEIRKSAIEWQTTFDSVEDQLLILDLDGVVRRINRAARKLIGDGWVKAIGKGIASFGPQPPFDQATRLLSTIRSDGKAQLIVEDSGSTQAWDVSGYLVTSQELEEERIILVIRNISTIVELREDLRRSETMSALGELIGGVAHEMRNPLFAISATADAFAEQFGDKDGVQPYFAAFRTQVDRMQRLMGQLLDYGKPAESGLPRSEVRLAEVVAEAIVIASSTAAERGIDISNQVSTECSPILGHRERLLMAISNLLDNAVRHAYPGTEVQVVGRHGCGGDNSWIECIVRDQGPGFNARDLPKIFDPFFSRRRGGTGLGLAIVQRVVEELGGRIAASNEPSGGAVVTMALPCRGGADGT